MGFPRESGFGPVGHQIKQNVSDEGRDMNQITPHWLQIGYIKVFFIKKELTDHNEETGTEPNIEVW